MSNELKIIPADFWHQPVTIIGDKQALEGLQRAVADALAQGQGLSTSFETDGEGFNVYVIQQDNLDNLPMHYVDDCCEEKDKDKWKNLHNLVKEKFANEEILKTYGKEN